MAEARIAALERENYSLRPTTDTKTLRTASTVSDFGDSEEVADDDR